MRCVRANVVGEGVIYGGVVTKPSSFEREGVEGLGADLTDDGLPDPESILASLDFDLVNLFIER